MSIQNQDTSTSFTSDGSTTVYSFSFKVFEESDLRLVVVDDLGSESELELETDYTVSLNEGEGGSVTLNTALTLGYELYIFRNTAIENDLEITQNYVNLKQLENKLDMLTVISQEQNEFNNRSIKLNEKSNLSNIELKEPVFGKYLKFDVDRNITNSDVSFTELIDTPDIVNSIESLTGAVTKAGLNIDQVTNTSDTQKVASGPIKVALDLKANTADVYTTGATDVLLDAKEDSLGNPSTSGQVLSSTNAGVRTWVTTSGAAPVDSVNSQTGVVSLGLDDLDNVNINTSTITDGQVVAWDNPTSMFVAATPSAGGAVDSVNGEIGVVVLDKTDIGLTNVDNTSDADKPVSTAQQTALDLKLNITDQYNTTVITGNYTLLDTDRVLVVNTTSDITITLGGTGLDLGRSIRVYSDVASHGILTFERGSGGDVVIAAGNLSKLPETIGMDTEFLEFQAFNGVGGNYWTALLNVPADGSVDTDKIADSAKNELAPIGSLSAFAGSTAPNKWLICNGAAVSRATYSDLYAVVGDVYGNGDGSTTFNLPDLRGEFIRGLDGGRGVDAARTLGSAQSDLLKSHTHQVQNVFSGGGTGDEENYVSNVTASRSTIDTLSSGGAETRPRNIAMNYIIKAEY